MYFIKCPVEKQTVFFINESNFFTSHSTHNPKTRVRDSKHTRKTRRKLNDGVQGAFQPRRWHTTVLALLILTKYKAPVVNLLH